MILQALGCFALAVVCLVVAVRPLATWRMTEAWKYRHPDAVEPSGAALKVTSLVFGAFAVLGSGSHPGPGRRHPGGAQGSAG